MPRETKNYTFLVDHKCPWSMKTKNWGRYRVGARDVKEAEQYLRAFLNNIGHPTLYFEDSQTAPQLYYKNERFSGRGEVQKLWPPQEVQGPPPPPYPAHRIVDNRHFNPRNKRKTKKSRD